MNENEISQIVIGAAIEVHLTLGGPGLLESVYQEALSFEMELRGLKVDREVQVELYYKEHHLVTPLRIELICL